MLVVLAPLGLPLYAWCGILYHPALPYTTTPTTPPHHTFSYIPRFYNLINEDRMIKKQEDQEDYLLLTKQDQDHMILEARKFVSELPKECSGFRIKASYSTEERKFSIILYE